MKKLIITADVHGSYSSWLTIKALMKPGDMLMVAGDLFDVRYGNYANPDFEPDSIKKELKTLGHDFFYVYGNCDTTSYFKGHAYHLETVLFDKHIFLHHGHRSVHIPDETDIVIQGHTHFCALEKTDTRIYLNPGSITCPRNGLATFAVMDKQAIHLIDLQKQHPMAVVDL
jgi:putative phosphoesterase